MRIMSGKYTNAIAQSPTIKDIMSYLIGMKTLFPDSSSNFGTLSYELSRDPGNIPSVSENISAFPVIRKYLILEKF